ncbi:Glycosyl hydrolases family 2, TIM barrel domain [Lentzea albidocapillata subsp. violacea]|uniref:Glycosyl hydrolases family 2, TIM barrel domain n=1 Tax=Lentzea albidocapillata subsp. violacea TaxID=128104 RepID=A0A1G8QSZ3_9PSEU|nr:PA14 domain-containing protein [Lentzea albidocapillata]SDJ07864.1 Glycosyl hydrolases family 2, TIM barrel domain [Lentzea albidocapillata subsp. violacea]
MKKTAPVLVALLLALGIAPGTPSAGAAEPVHGLKGEYFSMSAPGARDFATLGGTVLDADVNHGDLTGVFGFLNGRTEHTTARWTGQIAVPQTGDYTFHAVGDNGFRLLVDGKPVIDHWVGDWDREQTSAPVTLTAGRQYDFRLEMFQDVGGANMFLRWSSATTPKQIVPESAFTPPSGFQVVPRTAGVSKDGRTLTAEFDGRVSGTADLKDHLVVEVDATPMPISVVTTSRNRLTVRLAERVLKGQRVRMYYDGAGALAVGGKKVEKTARTVGNVSTERLRTPWGEKVDTRNPLPEYPRPQLERDKWLNLNGPWEFAGAKAGEQPVFGRKLREKVVVPYPIESQLSGLERHEDHMFYRRTVSVPHDWRIGSGQRLKLNFGAVDYHAKVWVNGRLVAEHTGGYTAFSADITDALKRGEQEIVVAVTDTTGPHQPKGKQSRNPSGIFYTPSSGIWQTVWMEPVADKGIDEIRTTPDLATSSLSVNVKSAGNATVTAVARDARGKQVGTVTGPANTKLTLPVPNPHLWTPDDPYLYKLDVTLGRDKVKSYFGMRSTGIANVGGTPKLTLNGQPIFSLMQLDQGFYPDGLNTAPSDEALIFDLKAQKDLGFNSVRKHIKAEPARWYYHADRLGLLVWQDFVSVEDGNNPVAQQAFLNESRELMQQLHNYPSIYAWIVFNEGWGEWDRTVTGQITDDVKAADPSRIVSAHSGVNCCASKGDSGKGDVIDHHDYNNTDPARPDGKRVVMDGEHGGFTLRTPGHQWPGAPIAIYSGVANKAALTAKYVDNTRTFYLGQARQEMSASVYTQVTDLEGELNGLWTYDRKRIKVDPGPVREINRRVIEAGANAGKPYPYAGSGEWKLNETTGTTAKDSTGANPLTLSPAGATWKDGALELRDGSAETYGPVVDTTKDYTVSAKVRLDELPGNWVSAVSQDGRQSENPFYLQYGQGAFAFSTPGGNRARYEITPEIGRWYEIKGERKGGEIRLYVDGALVATAPAGPAVESTGAFAVGRAKYNGQNVDFWRGAIKDVVVTS